MKLFGIFFTVVLALSSNSYAKERQVNTDIGVTGFNTVMLKQGMSRVYPVFKVKNSGNRTYKNIRLSYSTPSGLSDSGQNVSLRRSNNEWASITLKPGMEVTFNPARLNYTYLEASTDQAMVDYSTNYSFQYEDEEGHKYATPSQEITKFAQVTPYNSDVRITHYKTTILKQGESKVYPLFKIKNFGNRTYENVRLMYSTPSGLSDSGQNVSLRRRNNEWASITLKPGMEVTFNPARLNYTYLEAKTDQPRAIYSSEYSLAYNINNGSHFSTPRFEIQAFAVVGEKDNSKVMSYSQPVPPFILDKFQVGIERNPCEDITAVCREEADGRRWCGYPGETLVLCSSEKYNTQGMPAIGAAAVNIEEAIQQRYQECWEKVIRDHAKNGGGNNEFGTATLLMNLKAQCGNAPK